MTQLEEKEREKKRKTINNVFLITRVRDALKASDSPRMACPTRRSLPTNVSPTALLFRSRMELTRVKPNVIPGAREFIIRRCSHGASEKSPLCAGEEKSLPLTSWLRRAMSKGPRGWRGVATPTLLWSRHWIPTGVPESGQPGVERERERPVVNKCLVHHTNWTLAARGRFFFFFPSPDPNGTFGPRLHND